MRATGLPWLVTSTLRPRLTERSNDENLRLASAAEMVSSNNASTTCSEIHYYRSFPHGFRFVSRSARARRAILSAHHVVRRTWVAVDKHLNRTPKITGIGALEHAPAADQGVAAQVSCVLSLVEEQVAAQSRIWHGCARFAWTVNSRSLRGLDDRLADRCIMSGDRRPPVHGAKAILDYLSVALAQVSSHEAGDEIVAEVGHLGLTGEPCVLFWRGNARVSLANVRSGTDGKITAVHYIAADVAESVEGLGVCPGRQPR